MLLRIYSIGRFIITLILFCIIAWYGFSTLSQFHVRTNKAVVPINDLIQTTKDSQINLEKYRLFEQSAQLDAVATSVDLAEKKLNELVRYDIFKKPAVKQAIESNRNLLKSEKEMVANLKTIHVEQDLDRSSISTIGELRTEFETSADLALALQRLSLAEVDSQKKVVVNGLKIKLILVLLLALVLYTAEVVLSFLLKPKKRTEPVKAVEAPKPAKLGDVMVLNQKFQRVEETVEDIGERISLMAFNALLEATRAGEAGTGFKIVAEELKRLADRSVQSAGNVKRILAETSDLLSNADTTKS
jgi:hypothetical protein